MVERRRHGRRARVDEDGDPGSWPRSQGVVRDDRRRTRGDTCVTATCSPSSTRTDRGGPTMTDRAAARAADRDPRPAFHRAARPQDRRGGLGRRHHAAGLRRAGRRRHRRRRRRQPADRLRLGHRGHLGRQRRAAGRRGGAGAGRGLHAHLLHGHAVRGVRRRRREAQRADAGRPRQAFGAVQLRRRGGRERGQDRPPPHRPAGRRRLRPRLPRPDQPHDGADGEEHALQAAASARSPARSTACRWPTRTAGRPARRTVPTRRSRPSCRSVHTQVGEAEHRRGDPRADPGRGRLRRARRPVSWHGSPTGAPSTASCSSPTRSRPASAAPATGSPASSRASCRT